MSLINDMLNDLEDRRRGNQHAAVSLDWMTGQKTGQKKSLAMPLLSLLVVVALIIFAYKVWEISLGSDKPADSFLNAANAQQASTQARQTEEPLPKAVEPVEKQGVATTNQTDIDVEQVIVPVEAKAIETTPTETTLIAADIQSRENRPNPVRASAQYLAADVHQKSKMAEPALPQSSKKFNEKKSLIKSKKPLSNQERDKKVVAQAEGMLRSRNVVGAELLLSDFVAQQDYAPKAAEKLAAIYLSQKRLVKARTLLEAQRDLHPQSIALAMSQARLDLIESQSEAAVELLQAYRPSVNSYPEFYELLGLAARQGERFGIALNAYQQLLAFNDSRGDWWVGMAIVLDLQGQPSLARDAYRHGLQSVSIAPALKNYAQQRLASL